MMEGRKAGRQKGTMDINDGRKEGREEHRKVREGRKEGRKARSILQQGEEVVLGHE
jgi:hypothetical protein